jgi:hypothetical protein
MTENLRAQSRLHVHCLADGLPDEVATERDPISAQAVIALADGPAVILCLDDKDARGPDNDMIDISTVKAQTVEDVKLLWQPGEHQPDVLLAVGSAVVAICSSFEIQHICRTPAPEPEQRTAHNKLKKPRRPTLHTEENIGQEPHAHHWDHGPMHQAITLEIR